VGICQGSLEGVRVPDGDRHLRPGGMVPICLGVPDEIAIQSGLQPRTSNLSYLGWRQEAKMMLVQKHPFYSIGTLV
jgi:hypothetical protein